MVEKLIEEVAAELHRYCIYRAPHEGLSQDIDNLRKTLASAGWQLRADGTLLRSGDISIETGGREVLRQQIDRLYSVGDDVAHVLGLTKDTLEATARYIIKERGEAVGKNHSMHQLVGQAMDLLGLSRKPADDTVEAKAVAMLHQSITRNAEALNSLRNDQGTGHGRTTSATLPPEGARFVKQQTLTSVHYLLSTHDKSALP